MLAGSLEAAAVPAQARMAAAAATTTLARRAGMTPRRAHSPQARGRNSHPPGLISGPGAGRMEAMAHRSFALRRSGTDVAELRPLEDLTDQADPTEAARIVAEASAANLPEGNKTAARYLADPVRSFAVTEARSGVLEGARATFVRIGRKSPPEGD